MSSFFGGGLPTNPDAFARVFVDETRSELIELVPKDFIQVQAHTGVTITGKRLCWRAERARMHEFIESVAPVLQPSFFVFVRDPKQGWTPVQGHNNRLKYLLGQEPVKQEKKKRTPRFF